MLSFDTDFDLIHDLTPLFRNVIAEEVVALQTSPAKAPLHKPLDRGLTIVGVEKAYLLLAFDGYNKEKQTTATWIGLYDLRTALHRIVYKHYTLIHVVNASMCDGGNMLACTYSTIEPNIHSSREERYITCLIELSQHCRVYHLCSSNGSFQRAQFLHTDPAKPSSPTPSATTSSTSSASHSSPASTVKHSLLLFVHPDRIDLYTFVMGEKQGQWVRIGWLGNSSVVLGKRDIADLLTRRSVSKEDPRAAEEGQLTRLRISVGTVLNQDLYVLHARRFGSNPIDPSQVTTHNRKGVVLPGNSLGSAGNDTPKRTYDFTRCLRVVSGPLRRRDRPHSPGRRHHARPHRALPHSPDGQSGGAGGLARRIGIRRGRREKGGARGPSAGAMGGGGGGEGCSGKVG
ncbi:hypothetical protein BC936DRAFT_145880 [Jimgerdemannia flammicorona]|uniref:Uncharacterized protein n=1 Tax=Jimgerdemannia flammicorona TaxID=994334 RepID=A0A433DNA4_9FUNG|nr:hypothetical protein BC936DRAFT_145880 [Jimgerdemannia flammicorona]